VPAQRLIVDSELPSSEEKLAIFTHSVQRLTEAGYVYIGMDHFALPDDTLTLALRQGGLQRNFQGYSTHAECDLIGLGVSAISRVADGYSQNLADLADYRCAIDQGILPIARGVNLNPDDRIRADLIQQIMCDGRVSFSDFGQSHDIFFHQYFRDELAGLGGLVADGLLELDDEGFSVTPRGRIFLRIIAMRFDAYFIKATLQNAELPRYSKTL
jgi:oxygen-independent coproporphyrinogen-3 oxidase